VRWSLAIVLALSATAAADPWKTTIDVVLRQQPGEHAKAVATVRAGTIVTVEKEEGRWLRVRAGGDRVGYVTRTTVVDAGASRGGGAQGKWAAEHPKLTVTDATATLQTTAVAAPAPAAEPPPPPRDPHLLRGGATLGYRSLGMDFSSDGAGGLASYLISADALAAVLDGDAALPLGRLRAGADARVTVSTSAPGPGIRYTGPSAPSGDIPFQTVAADAGVRGGIARGAFELALRAGVHYDAFLAKNVDNAGHLPREQLLGGTLGARVAIAPPGSRFDVALAADALVIGARSQTAGLEDGSASRAHAVWGGATIRFELRPHWSLVSGIELWRATTSWSGMSRREPGVMHAERVDTSQIIEIGVSAER